MKASILLVLLVITVAVSPSTRGFAGPSSHLASLPLCFEANGGQVDPAVQYLAHGRGYAFYLTSTGAVLVLSHSRLEESGAQARGIRDDASFLRMEFIGANPTVRMTGVAELAGKVNYLWGSDPAQWHKNVAAYSKVQCEQVYPGIDLVFYGSDQRRLEFDWVVAPGGDPKVITLSLEGANSATVDPTGDLILQAGGGEIRQHRPIIYQWVDGARRVADGGYIAKEAASMAERDEARVRRWLVSFNIPAYDLAQPLVIDPVLSYASFLGGTGNDSAAGIALDPSGNVYITGEASAYLPVVKAFQGLCGGCWDAFLTKLSADGATILYSTYLGGSGCDSGAAVAVDAQQNAYVTGVTSSPDWPTRSAMQADFRGGGPNNPNNNNGGGCIALDAADNAFVTGQSYSSDFPTKNAWQPTMINRFQPNLSGYGFVSKLNANGSALVYSTFLLGFGYTAGVAVDQAGSVYVAGLTVGNLPAVNAVQTNYAGGNSGDWEGCLLKLDPDGQSVQYATYLGGTSGDGCTGIAVDRDGNAYVTGSTASTNFPTQSALQPAFGGGPADGFVVKISDPDTTPPVLLAASNYGDAAVVTVDFSEALDLASATNATHYTMDHGITVNSATMGINSRTVRLLTTGLTHGVAYTLTVNGVLDRAPVPNSIASDTHVTFTALGLYRGFLHQEVYAGINGGNLADLTNNVKFPNQPDTSSYVHQSEILSRAASQCGSRLAGYLIPSVTGDYTLSSNSRKTRRWPKGKPPRSASRQRRRPRAFFISGARTEWRFLARTAPVSSLPKPAWPTAASFTIACSPFPARPPRVARPC